ncbi:hypothetical protein OPQ81_000288 [Rhizoctonia solani]|nr:hypothetical protein OPQ81_000288 [Rhizoctonia solani]
MTMFRVQCLLELNENYCSITDSQLQVTKCPHCIDRINRVFTPPWRAFNDQINNRTLGLNKQIHLNHWLNVCSRS